ncbi:MAG: hypothetical protein J6P98_00130 [Clostridia bacterium]|nr:hypothetical protein [Clostridia bacterium]
MYVCSSCRLDGRTECDFSTVTAGDVSVGLAMCGYEPAAVRLPRVSAADQNYSAGLCPNCALSVGTMFPELADSY